MEYHYENKPVQIYWESYHQKWKISDNIFWFFFIFLLKTYIVDTR